MFKMTLKLYIEAKTLDRAKGTVSKNNLALVSTGKLVRDMKAKDKNEHVYSFELKRWK